MRLLQKPIIAWFLLVFYLLGSHAGAHGLAWCLGADGHAHLETSASACDSSSLPQPCESVEVCITPALAHPPLSPQQTECRHLPVGSQHAPLVQNTLKTDKLSPQDSSPVFLQPLWRQKVEDNYNVFCSPASSLPPTQALTALRTVVLRN